MSARSVFCSALVIAVLGSGMVRAQSPYPSINQNFGPGQAQTPYTPNNPLDERPGQTGVDYGPTAQPTLEKPGTLSTWITGPRSVCCFGPVGANGPIKEEVFACIGPSIPFGDGVLARS